MMKDKKSQRTNRNVLKVYDGQRTAYKSKQKESPEERQKRRRAQALEELDKRRKWISLWDVENEQAKKKTYR